MRSSRTPQSIPSISSRTYLSEQQSRRKSCSSNHSDGSASSNPKSNRKMKCIICMGVALPVIAAIIGVVAWAVSADSAFHGPLSSSLRRSDVGPHEEDIFQALENRQDLDYSHRSSSSNAENDNKDYSRIDTSQNLQIANQQFDDTVTPEKDPLYIVHFVPSPKPNNEVSTSGPEFGSTVSTEVIKKILSASKGNKPGIPQFVVFAPLPGEEGSKGNGMNNQESQGLNFLSNPLSNPTLQPKPIINKEVDYDYEEELRKYEEMLNPKTKDSRVGEPTRTVESNSQKESVKIATQNHHMKHVLVNQQHHKQQASDVGLIASEFNPQPHIAQIPQVAQNGPQVIYQNYQPVPQSYQQAIPQNYPQPVPQNYPQAGTQNYQQNVPQDYSQIAPRDYPGTIAQDTRSSYQQSSAPQQYYQQPQQQQESTYQQQSHPQPAATDRSGYEPPVGIKLNFGGGRPRGLLGGGYSPLGIIGSLLSPILPRPRVNLNGKLMFGVMLENGIQFGKGENRGK